MIELILALIIFVVELLPVALFTFIVFVINPVAGILLGILLVSVAIATAIWAFMRIKKGLPIR